MNNRGLNRSEGVSTVGDSVNQVDDIGEGQEERDGERERER